MPKAGAKLLTLALAWTAAEVCQRLKVPIPWMLGPLVATALATISGLPTSSSLRLRNFGQWTMGASLGLYFTPLILAQLLSLWWGVLLAVIWSLVLGGLYGRWLYRSCVSRLPGVSDKELMATAYFSGAIGAASEMTLLAEREGARSDLVAAAHSLRMLIVVLVIPFGMLLAKSWWKLEAVDLVPPAIASISAAGFALMVLFTGSGGLAMHVARLPNPWFLGPLLVSSVMAASETAPSSVSVLLSHAAQLVIGVSLGVRFSRVFLQTARRWMTHVVLGTVGLLLACCAFGVVLAWAAGLHPATAILGTAPGGMTEMSITAKVLQMGVPIVTALQVTRLVAVLVLVRPAFRIWKRKS